MQSDRVRVAVRIRPRLPALGEQFAVKCCSKAEAGGGEPWDVLLLGHSDDTFTHRQHAFRFHHVFDEDDSQVDVYEGAALDMAEACLAGHSATILAYGQTGSGKTHTILGEVDPSGIITPGSGILPRVLTDLYAHRARAPGHVVVCLSVLEIYNDTLRDLLQGGRRLTLRQTNDGAVPVGLRRAPCDTLARALEEYHRAEPLRRVASTAMNDASSRSHACFIIEIFQQPRTPDNPDPPDLDALLLSEGDPAAAAGHLSDTAPRRGSDTVSRMTGRSPRQLTPPVKRSTLTLVDLAGSERLKKSNAAGAELKEALAINTSLSCLGNVVNGLYRGDKHIPYRDSLLTMLLQSALTAPTSRTLLIANVSPALDSFQESLSSIRFADRVMGLKTGDVQQRLDVEWEADFLGAARDFGMLLADLRIAMATEDHQPTVRPLRLETQARGERWRRDVPLLVAAAKGRVVAEERRRRDALARRLAFTRANHERWFHRWVQAEGLELRIREAETAALVISSQHRVEATALAREARGYEVIHAIRRLAHDARLPLLARRQRLQEALVLVSRGFVLLHHDLDDLRRALLQMETEAGAGRVFDFTDFVRSKGSGIFFDADLVAEGSMDSLDPTS